MDSRTWRINNNYNCSWPNSNHRPSTGGLDYQSPARPAYRSGVRTITTTTLTTTTRYSRPSPQSVSTSSHHQRGLAMRERGVGRDPRGPLRVVIMGASGVGKTALTVRLITKRFIGEYCPTLENVYNYHCTVDDEDARLEVLDTAGEAEDTMTEFYATWGDCYVWIYSITDKHSLSKLTSLHEQWLQQRRQGACVHVVLGNKTDLGHQRQVMGMEGQALANRWNCPFYEISVAEGDHTCVITDIFKGAVRTARQTGILSPLVDNTTCNKKTASNSSVAIGKFRHAIQKVMMGGRTYSPKMGGKVNSPKTSKKSNAS